MFQKFCACTRLDRDEFTGRFQKSKSLGADLVFKERLELRKNR